jgi:hypothetical protein
MNSDITDWSLPWHELQRTLAAGFGAHAASVWQSRAEGTDVHYAPAPANSWLSAHSRPVREPPNAK